MKTLGSSRQFFSTCRSFHASATKQRMKAWQTHKYGPIQNLELNSIARTPVIEKPTDVLIKVEATSVNPIDVKMLNGYGATLVNNFRRVDHFPECLSHEFPLTLGRDFAGTVVDYGKQVTNFKAGDKVWGALGVQRQGCHAEYALSAASAISLKPESLSFEDAAALPYVALTFYSAWLTAGFLAHPYRNLRVLVLGGAGGVGSFAIQYLKCLGCEVTTTCSTDAQQEMYRLGADFVVDYKAEDAHHKLAELSGFHFILDAAGIGFDSYYLKLLKENGFSKYVTLVSPVLKSIDKFGLIPGTAVALTKAVQDTFTGLSQGKHIRWAFFAPSGQFLKEVAQLVDAHKIQPFVDRVFRFENIQEAYCYVEEGHARGKTVINVSNENQNQTV